MNGGLEPLAAALGSARISPSTCGAKPIGEIIARTVFTCSHRFQISIASPGGAEAFQVIRVLLIGTLIAIVNPNTTRRQMTARSTTANWALRTAARIRNYHVKVMTRS